MATALPSQHVGKEAVMRRPKGHGSLGKPRLGSELAAAGPQGVLWHRKEILFSSAVVGLGVRRVGEPTSMRKPFPFLQSI